MSTYSPSLRIELITTGDQAGTWGNTTNTNLGTLIESSIAGYTSVAVASANQAFTALNGAPDEARHMTIALTTSTGANFAVYAPPAEKTYVIYNASSYVATIYNSTVLGNTTAAGTGVAIPAGKTMTVWSEGTNFRVQNDHIIGTVVGNVTGNLTGNVTGNLNGNLTATAPTANTAAFGTNTTQVATTAFVQAALQALHPVGSIYINATNATNPGTLLGFGTWTAFGAGRVPVGFNASDPDFDTAEETGGAKTVASSGTISGTVGGTSLTEAQMPKHYHLMLGPNSVSSPQGSGSGVGVYGGGTPDDGTQAYGTYSTGGNASSGAQTTGTSNGDSHAHSFSGTYSGSATSVLQPYITVYMWKRTA
jgi:hypothetical protein